MASVQAVREFTGEVQEEVKKVTWPDWPQLRNATGVILVFVTVVALIIWLMDLAVRNVLDLVINLLAG